MTKSLTAFPNVVVILLCEKKMTQWSMRISAYAERLLQGLETIDWTDSLKESQRNWIGKSVGASVTFNVNGHDKKIDVFTTRPDTIYGVSFMTLAPEHDYVSQITTPEQKEAVDAYVEATAKRSERERMADVKNYFWCIYWCLCRAYRLPKSQFQFGLVITF